MPSRDDCCWNSLIAFRFDQNVATNIFWLQYNMSQLGKSKLYRNLQCISYVSVGLLKCIDSLRRNIPTETLENLKNVINNIDKLHKNINRNVRLPFQGVMLKIFIEIKIETNDETMIENAKKICKLYDYVNYQESNHDPEKKCFSSRYFLTNKGPKWVKIRNGKDIDDTTIYFYKDFFVNTEGVRDCFTQL